MLKSDLCINGLCAVSRRCEPWYGLCQYQMQTMSGELVLKRQGTMNLANQVNQVWFNTKLTNSRRLPWN